MPELHVFLFDIDGVLVAPLGYRAAVRATLKFFFDRLGFPDDFLPDEFTLSGFEAIRITSEWDMVPICLAAVIDSWLEVNPGVVLSGSLPEVIRQIGRLKLVSRLPQAVDYLGLQSKLKGRLPSGIYPAETILQLSGSEQPQSLFSQLVNQRLLDDLFAHTRDLDHSMATRIFQNYSIGSDTYRTCYRRSPELQTTSLLADLDQPQLPRSLSRQIMFLNKSKRLYPAAFTTRPSLAPRHVEDPLPLKYVPEAEIALDLVGLAEIPLIGYGRIIYLADLLGLEPESLLKPSPVQALAASLAAVQGDEIQALRRAYNVYAKSDDFPDYIGFNGSHLNLYVFEDSAGGIEAVQTTARIFNRSGIRTSVWSYGIATHTEKIAALNSVGASIYASTEKAVIDALSKAGLQP